MQEFPFFFSRFFFPCLGFFLYDGGENFLLLRSGKAADAGLDC